MPPLGPIVDLRDDPRLDMQIMAGAGQAIGNVVAARRIKQEEQYNQVLQQQFVGVMNRAAEEDWEPDRMLAEMARVPGMARTEFGRQMQQQFLMDQYKRMMAKRTANQPVPEGLEISGGQYDEYGNFLPSYSRPRQERTSTQIVPEMRDGKVVNVLYDKDTGREVRTLGEKPPTSRSGEDAVLNNLNRQYNAMLTAYNETFDDMGDPIPELEADRQFARNQILQLRQKIEAAGRPKPVRYDMAADPRYKVTVDPLAYEPSPGQPPRPAGSPQTQAPSRMVTKYNADGTTQQVPMYDAGQAQSQRERAEGGTSQSPAEELDPYWEGLSEEDKADVQQAIKEGITIEQIAAYLKERKG
jgi:hypothetical protein